MVVAHSPRLAVVVVGRDLADVDMGHLDMRPDWEVAWRQHLALAWLFHCWALTIEVYRLAYLVYPAKIKGDQLIYSSQEYW